MYAVAVSARPEVPWWHGLISAVINMLAGALLGIGVWKLAQRAPIRRLGASRFIGIHVLGAAAYSIGWVFAQFGWLWLVADLEVVRYVWQQAGLWQLMT